MTPALATYTGTVTEAMVYAPSNVTYRTFQPEGSVFLVKPHAVNGDLDYLADVKSQLSRLWAEDWDSPEDSVYDAW